MALVYFSNKYQEISLLYLFSEDISPQSEKMDETSDHSTLSTDCEVVQHLEALETPESLDNDHCSNLQTMQIAASTTSKNVSKSIVTNSHPLMYSPDSDTGTLNESRIDNFAPGAHSSFSKSVESNLGSLDLELDLPNIESYCDRLPDFPESPTAMKKSLMYDMPLEVQPGADHSDTENDRSIYEAVLSPNLQNVSLTMHEKHGNLNFLSQVQKSNKLRKIKVVPESHTADSDVSSIDSVSDSIKSEDVYPEQQTNNLDLDLDMNLIKELLDSPDDIDDSILLGHPDFTPRSGDENSTPTKVPSSEPIREYSAEEERRDSRHWQKIVLPSGEQRSIDMRVIEPYKRVLSHGGYLQSGGHNAIIIFSACYLPDKSRKDYVYVMDNLFL